MNILIRKFENCKHNAEFVAVLEFYTDPQYYDKMKPNVPISVKDKRLKNDEIIITKQSNGNLCFEFKEDKQDE